MKKKYIIIILLIILLDQLLKYLVTFNFKVYESVTLIKNFLSLEYVQNTGMSFGWFSGGIVIISLISLLIIGFMINDLCHSTNKLHCLSDCLIIGGALGNLIDRVIRGYVVDYISFTLFNYKMAIFNFADICVVVGVIIYFLLMILEGKEKDGKDSGIKRK